MKYKLIGNNYTFMPTETIFENRHINPNELFELDCSIEEHYDLYDNMKEGVELLDKHIKQNDSILLVVDSDVDGFTSSAILYMYLKSMNPDLDIKYILHTGKQHGLSYDITSNIKPYHKLVILPDASSGDYKQHKELRGKGVDVLVIDHHNADNYSENAVVINNQLSKNIKNKYLSGVGVVYKFLQALDDYYFEYMADEYLDLVALGNIADAMDLKERETRYYVCKGIENVKNEFLKELINVSAFGLEGKYNIISIGWTIAPKLNGTIRSGTQEEKELMFRALIEDEEYFEYKPRNGEPYEENLQQHMARICGNVKTRQDNAVKKGMDLLSEKLNDTRKLIIEDATELNPNFTGLVAGKLASKYHRPVILYRDNDKGYYTGSGRGEESVIPDLQKFIRDSNSFIFAEGHPNAMGIRMEYKDLDGFIKYSEDKLKDIELQDEDLHMVDLILEDDELDFDIINEICKYENEWGNGLDEPLIVIKNIKIHTSEIQLLGKRNPKNIVFNYKDIKFLKRYANDNTYKELLCKNKIIEDDFFINISLIGKCKNHIYNDTITPQIEIVDIETNRI